VINIDRMNAANQALKAFPIGNMFQFELKNNRLAVYWMDYWTRDRKPRKVSKVWHFQYDGSLWPKFRLPTGGTLTQFIGQLVRWIRDKPVLPLYVLRHWDSPNYGLFGSYSDAVLAILIKAGYPETVKCVVCGDKPNGMDWWSRDNVSGPCCNWGSCEEKCKKIRDEGLYK